MGRIKAYSSQKWEQKPMVLSLLNQLQGLPRGRAIYLWAANEKLGYDL